MSDTSAVQSPSPAVLRFRGLDVEAAIASQARNIATIRRMTNSMCDSARAIVERHGTLLTSGAARMNASGEYKQDMAHPGAIFGRQTQAARELAETLAIHVGEITSKCCVGPIDEVTATVAGASVDQSRAKQTGKGDAVALKADSRETPADG